MDSRTRIQITSGLPRKRTGRIAALLIVNLTVAVPAALAEQASSSVSASAPASESVPPPSGLLSKVPGLGDLIPPSLDLGSFEKGTLTLRPTLNQQIVGFLEVNSGWGGNKFDPPIQESKHFFEQANQAGLDATLDLDQYGTMFARVSGIFDSTGGGINPLGTNYGSIETDEYSIESAYLKWSSGRLFPSLGEDAVQVIGGRYTYRIGDGFLFYNGASGGGNNTAPWLAPRNAFAQTGIFRLDTHRFLLEGFYLSPADKPKTHTRLAGVNLKYQLTELLSTGFTYANIFHSDTVTRQGLNVLYWRGEGSPIARIKDFYLSWSAALESNGNVVPNAYAWYITPSYTFSKLLWQPTLYYRYASFSGGGTNGNRDFDPLFYGMSDWGTWYQGDIMGNWIASNSNLNTQQVRLTLTMEDSVINLIYYHFSLDSEQFSSPKSPVTSKNLADEINLDWDVKLANWWAVTLMVGANAPGTAAKEALGAGSQTWFQAGLWTAVSL